MCKEGVCVCEESLWGQTVCERGVCGREGSEWMR